MRLLSSRAATNEYKDSLLDSSVVCWMIIKLKILMIAALILLYPATSQAKEKVIYFDIPQRSVNRPWRTNRYIRCLSLPSGGKD